MSSHHEWAESIEAAHQVKKPFASENGTSLRFSVGDRVIYKNSARLEFSVRIIGLYLPKSPCSLYALGARYLISSSSPWFPVKESELRLNKSLEY